MTSCPHVSQPLARTAISALLLAASALAQAANPVPSKDLKGLTDPNGLSRYAGSVLVYRDDAAYDEIKFPVGKVVYKDEQAAIARSQDRAGQRTMLQYLTPAGKSALEVVRNYQQDLKAAGYKTTYECTGEACGNADWITKGYFMSVLVSGAYWSNIGDNSPAACGGGANIGDFRYALLDNPATGSTIAVAAWRPGILSAYCDEPEYQKRTSIIVVKVDTKAREQAMETLSANEMGKSLDVSGKVAVYGILFDTAKADIKPESRASLDQIGALLKQQTRLKLHVVGHTDNAGSLTGNIDLSKRRAEAVVAALASSYGIARDRLTANGVASLAPVASNGDEAGKAKNRRVELVLQ
ncbi:MAG: OmpA family protein [Rhodoferax sp.]|nr:OmpA family protein [Rhodoferax sp.]